MKVGGTVGGYVFREMIPPFFVNLAVLTFVFLMAKILNITDLIINYGVSLSSVFLLLAYSIPSFLVFVLPMSTMMGTLLAFLRLSHDNEVVALKASGFSVYGFLPPVLFFSLIGCLLTGLMTMYGSPLGRLAFKALLFETATSNLDIGLKARTFNDSFKGMMLYVSQIDPKDRALKDVFIEDRQTPGMVTTVIAPEGKLVSNPETLNFQMILFRGLANRVDLRNKTVHSVSFDTYDLNLELSRVRHAERYLRTTRKEMTVGELRESIHRAEKDSRSHLVLMEYHKRFSIPVGCLVLGLVAVPLGIQSKHAKRSFGMVLGLLSFLIHYVLTSAGWICGESGMFHPVVAMWGPDLVIGLLGLYLLRATARERPMKWLLFLPRLLMWPKPASPE